MNERGGQVEQLLSLPERQEGMIIHRQVSDLRVSTGLHPATSARHPHLRARSELRATCKP
jgi:hypothetical protein